tara:strand:+ start:98 stop:616 length:519 start_codon:yes stop_codon:yes gene_type:complete
MKIKIFPIFFIIIFLIIFLIFYKGLKNPNIYEPKVNLEKNIPVFVAKIFSTNDKINSEKIFTDDKFYLMNIWASWCMPCREEHVYLMNLSTQKNIEIVGLNYKDKYENAKNFLNKSNNPYNFIFSDTNGTIAVEWGAYGVPESFLIYKNKIIKKIIGPIDQNSLLEIKKLIQ